MLLRDDAQSALNQVETLCLTSADDYAAVAERAKDAALAMRFEELARERREMASELAPHIRALDDLPQEPDPDREAIDHVLVGIEAFLSGNSNATLLAHRARGEAELQEALQSGLQADLPGPTHSLLERMHHQVAQTREWLEHEQRDETD